MVKKATILIMSESVDLIFFHLHVYIKTNSISDDQPWESNYNNPLFCYTPSLQRYV